MSRNVLLPWLVGALVFVASMAGATTNVWDGTTDQNWTGANWTIDGGGAGGIVPPDAGTPGVNLIDYLYTGHDWWISDGTINQDVQVRLDGGSLTISNSNVTLLPTSAATSAGLSGLNLGQSGTPTMATLTDSTLTTGRSNADGNSLRLMSGSSLSAVDSEINVQAESGSGDLDLRSSSVLSLTGTTVNVQRNSNLRDTATLSLDAGSTLVGQGLEVLSANAAVTFDGATMDIGWIRLNSGAETTRNLMFNFSGGEIVLTNPNPTRDSSSFEGCFNWTGPAGSGTVTHTDLSDGSERTLAYKVFQGFFSIDGVRVNPTTADPRPTLGTATIEELNAELLTLAVNDRYLQVQETNHTHVLNLEAVPPAPELVIQPVSPFDAVLGGETTLGIGATGQEPLGYQWNLGGAPIAGATNTSLIITNAGEGAAGPYTCAITNFAGSVTSSNVFLSFIGPALDPAEQVVFGLNPIVITPDLPDGPGRTYTWHKDGVVVDGQTDLALVMVSASALDGGTYELIYSLGGNTVTSETATVVVPPPPADSYANIVAGDTPQAYWRLGESAGASTAEEEIAFVAVGGLDGDYLGNTVAGESGALLGDLDTALLCLGDTNSLVEVPGGSDTVATLGQPAGASIPFSVEVWALSDGGAGTFRSPFTYLDYLNDTSIMGWTLLASDQNRWEFRTGQGIVPSNAFNVIEGPAVELGEWTHLVGTFDGTDLKFYVDGALAGVLAGAPYAPPDSFSAFVPCLIGGGSRRSASAPVGSRGDYWEGKVDEAAYYGYALTASQVLEHYAGAFPLDTPPVLDIQPEDLAVLEGVDASFFVAAHSTTPMSYQWRKGGSPLAGGTNQMLVIAGTLSGDGGSYDVIIDNAGGGSVTSEVASLAVYTEVEASVLSVNFLGSIYANAQGQTNVSVGLNGGVAGYIATNGWNEIGLNSARSGDPAGSILDVRGADTGITLSWTSDHVRWSRIEPASDADQAMLQGGWESQSNAGDTADGGETTVTISNVPPQYMEMGYDLIVYLGGPASSASNRYHNTSPSFFAELSDGGTAYYYHTRDVFAWDGNYVAATETDPNVTNGLADANMAIFAALTDPVVTLTLDYHPVIGEGPGQISGFQIVPGRTAPALPLTIGRSGVDVVVDWMGVGVLQNATDLSAQDWTDVDGGTVTNGPYMVPAPLLPVESFRLREP